MKQIEEWETITFGSKLTSANMKMTPSQEKAIERGILHVMGDQNWLYHRKKVTNRIKFLRKLELTPLAYGAISVYMIMDNGKPGTLGYTMPDTAHFFVGKKGGYTCYSQLKKRKNNPTGQIKGPRALIFC